MAGQRNYAPVPLAGPVEIHERRPGYFGDYPLASWGRRVAAGFIDYGLPVLPSYMMSPDNPLTWVTTLVAFGYIIFNTGYLAGITGRSIGKRLTHLYLGGKRHKEPPGARRGIIRALLTGLPFVWPDLGAFPAALGLGEPTVAIFFIGIFCTCGLIFPFRNPYRQTLGDIVTSTVLVRQTWEGDQPPDWPILEDDPRFPRPESPPDA